MIFADSVAARSRTEDHDGTSASRPGCSVLRVLDRDAYSRRPSVAVDRPQALAYRRFPRRYRRGVQFDMPHHRSGPTARCRLHIFDRVCCQHRIEHRTRRPSPTHPSLPELRRRPASRCLPLQLGSARGTSCVESGGVQGRPPGRWIPRPRTAPRRRPYRAGGVLGAYAAQVLRCASGNRVSDRGRRAQSRRRGSIGSKIIERDLKIYSARP